MNEVTLIGIDLGKHSFHLHAQDATGRMVFRKKLSRQQLLRTLANVPSCRVVMEACAGSHWLARQLAGMGHEPRLISPQFVRPFVAGNKNDFGATPKRSAKRLVDPACGSLVLATRRSRRFRPCIASVNGWCVSARPR